MRDCGTGRDQSIADFPDAVVNVFGDLLLVYSPAKIKHSCRVFGAHRAPGG